MLVLQPIRTYSSCNDTTHDAQDTSAHLVSHKGTTRSAEQTRTKSALAFLSGLLLPRASRITRILLLIGVCSIGVTAAAVASIVTRRLLALLMDLLLICIVTALIRGVLLVMLIALAVRRLTTVLLVGYLVAS